MRIRFFTPDSEREAAAYVELVGNIDRFWAHFRQVAEGPPTRWLGDARAMLARVNTRLGLEVRSDFDGTKTLYVVPLDGLASSSLAMLCVQRAPVMVPWLFEALRPAQALETALATIAQDLGFELEQARARVGVTRGHLVEVVLASHHFHGSADELGQDAAELLLTRLLGDVLFEEWVGAVSVQGTRRPSVLRVVGEGTHELPLLLSEVASAVGAARDGVIAGLSVQPYHAFCEHADWTMLEISAPVTSSGVLRVSDVARADQTGSRTELITLDDDGTEGLPHHDLLFASTICPEAMKCFLSGLPFCSKRFSRHGERFCYLQLLLQAPDDEARLNRRAELEDQLNRALVPGRLGCVVGSGMGTTYTYIHLALTNIEAALDLLERRLRRFGIQHNAWLLFCDDEWRDEWVSLGEDRRPPPHH